MSEPANTTPNPYRTIAAWLLRQHVDQCGVDGADLQAALVQYGLLEPVEAAEQCGEECQCAAYGGFPQTCYRPTEAGRQALAATQSESEPLYVIQDTRDYSGRSVVWWRPAQKGYTCNLDKAGRYTAVEAESIQSSSRGLAKAWPVQQIESLADRYVDIQKLPTAPEIAA